MQVKISKTCTTPRSGVGLDEMLARCVVTVAQVANLIASWPSKLAFGQGQPPLSREPMSGEGQDLLIASNLGESGNQQKFSKSKFRELVLPRANA